ncbi:helix-turn-helix transcriptional regulator [Haloferax sp. DFSO52]|uniref:helix-turn-helix transcriptional regulator n=1 Tax=Haloferax sp. DFSO52 TaxID=3388505 RepID=UPI003A8774FF
MNPQTSRRNSSLLRDGGTLEPDGKPVDSASRSDHPLLGVEPELLNPERRILQLLLVEGGVLAQSEIVERSRWSDSTISRTLCRLEAQERVVRRQDGGGKLVILPQSDT